MAGERKTDARRAIPAAGSQREGKGPPSAQVTAQSVCGTSERNRAIVSLEGGRRQFGSNAFWGRHRRLLPCPIFSRLCSTVGGRHRLAASWRFSSVCWRCWATEGVRLDWQGAAGVSASGRDDVTLLTIRNLAGKIFTSCTEVKLQTLTNITLR